MNRKILLQKSRFPAFLPSLFQKSVFICVICGSSLFAQQLTLENDLRVEGDTKIDGTIVIQPQGGIPSIDLGSLNPTTEEIRVKLISSTNSQSTVDTSVSPTNPLSFSQEEVDTHNAWDTNTFTAPFQDDYSVSVTVSLAEGATALGNAYVDLYINNSLYKSGLLVLSLDNRSGSFSTLVPLASGDTLQLRTNYGNTQVSQEPNHISIHSFKAGKATVTQGGVGASNLPVGTVIIWMQETPPAGYLSCDGTAYDRVQYAQLYNVIGNSYGTGSSQNEFKVPDLRGYFLRGWDNGANIDPDAADRLNRGDGRNGPDWVGTKQEDEFQSHSHGIEGAGLAPSPSGTSGQIRVLEGETITRNTSVEGDSTETRPKNIAVHYCIKFK